MKREREKHITRLHIILFFMFLILVLIVFLVIKSSKKNNINNYKEFEKEMVVATEIYYQINDLTLQDGGEKRITLNQLKKQNLITNDLKDKCTGYVVSTSEKNLDNEYEIVHMAYIKCSDKYTTINYEEY